MWPQRAPNPACQSGRESQEGLLEEAGELTD